GVASAQKRTDVVTLRNGDHLTGEVVKLDRGRLQFKTDDEGTLEIEWDKIATVAAVRQFEVGTSDGRRFVGALVPGNQPGILVVEETTQSALPMEDVTLIAKIGGS